ncbi:MAG: helix-turn-helix transcriptional regulator [Finegoldia magna]|nr:helix-turn-helix transcriptional regulator [Finegoldia magna]
MIENIKLTLKALRVNRGYNQIDAARKLGVAVSTLSSWEQGKTFPDVEHIKKIEELYSTEYKNIIFLPKNYAKSVRAK